MADDGSLFAYASVATAPWKAVRFECGHVEWVYAEEYGDGSAWCQACDQVRSYDEAQSAVYNACAECDYEDCGPESVCAVCGHCDWREGGEAARGRPPITDADWGWRAALREDDLISLPEKA